MKTNIATLSRSSPENRLPTRLPLRAAIRLGVGALLAALALGRAQGQTYNFNSGATNFSPTTFTANNPGGGITTYSATGGIGGTGSFSTNGVTNQTVIFNTPLTNSTGAVFTTSFYFQTRPTLSTNDLVGFGYFGSTSQLFDADNLIGYKINGANSNNLLASTWYQLSATTTNTGSTFQTTLSLQNYGASGTTLTGSPISIGASDNSGGTLFGTNSIYVGIYGGGGIQGGFGADFQTLAIDNFSVSAIPEPSTYAVIAGAAMLGLAVWRRRRGKTATVTANFAG